MPYSLRFFNLRNLVFIMEQVIAAIATPQGRGGVSVVRLSGEGALPLARKMFSKTGEFIPNTLYVGDIDCGAFRDRGMCVWFRAPKSFTGEDVVEFHCHGGVEITRGVLDRALSLGARLAERGEFTKRAFLNGKLSLSAAEGMADMIDAESQAQVRAGYSLYTERLTNEGKRLQSLLTTCLAGIDADLDYPEEDLQADTAAEVLQKLQEVKGALQALLKQYRAGRKIKSGVTAVFCGKPNAGKSSLFNALLGCDRSIVTEIPGTTRDTVEGAIEINGVRFNLIDTAGLREGTDVVEREGIRRAELAVKNADLILWLKGDGEEEAFPPETPVITVGAKSDLVKREGCDVCVSSVTGEGIGALKELMYERGFGRESDVFVLEERHYRAAEEACGAVEKAEDAVKSGLPAELYAEEVHAAWVALGAFSGETASEAVISEIFDKFCVGK